MLTGILFIVLALALLLLVYVLSRPVRPHKSSHRPIAGWWGGDNELPRL